MTVAERMAFALVYPVLAPVLLIMFVAVLLTAYPVILLVGTAPINENPND